MVDGGAQGLAATDYLRKPRCPSCWTCGAQQDSRPHQDSFLVASYVEHRGRIHAILSGLPVGEIRPKEESRRVTTNSTTRAEMAVYHYKPGYKFARV